VLARALTVVVLLLLVTFGGAASATRAEPIVDAEFAFTAALRGQGYNGSAVCVSRGGEPHPGRRLTRVGRYATAWSRDGSRIAIAGGKPGIRLIRIAGADGAGERAITAPRPTEQDSSPSWSPDGKTIVFSRYVFFGPGTDYRRAGIWLVDVGTRQERQITPQFGGPEWSPTGDVIAAEVFGSSDAELMFLTPDGVVARRIRLPRGAGGGMSWSPDGTRLAIGDGLIIDRTGQTVGRYGPPKAPNGRASFAPSWSPNGSTIVFVSALFWTDARTHSGLAGNGDLFSTRLGESPVALTRTTSIDEGSPEFRPGMPGGSAGIAQPCVLRGTPGRDVIRGTPGDDLVDAVGGNDAVYGGGGDDLVVGGRGNDFLNGGAGRDDLRAGTGNDRLYARDGASDWVGGGLGRDRAWVDRKDSTASIEMRYSRR
jgi:dipeptidyl aminopeptidase/acylaminoacyl peptidase